MGSFTFKSHEIGASQAQVPPGPPYATYAGLPYTRHLSVFSVSPGLGVLIHTTHYVSSSISVYMGMIARDTSGARAFVTLNALFG